MGAARRVDLWDHLAENERIGLDTSVFIYYINRQQPYFPLCRDVLRGIESGRLRSVISTVNEMEMLVEPLAKGRLQVVNHIEDLLRRLTNLQVLPVDGTIARRAAELRAHTRLPGIDALIAATAITSGCRHVLGNDSEFARRLTDISYLLLDDFI